MATTTDWNRLQSLFDQAARLPAAERDSFLRQRCGQDSAMHAQIQRLLKIDQQQGLLDSPIHPSAAAADHTMVGRQIGRYKLVRLIASGGMGTVYEAQQDHPRRLVALKLMHRSGASRSALRRFEAEADILGRLQHQAIAQIFDAGVYESDEGAQPYFAMELIDGLAIGDYADKHDLGTRQRLALLEKVCQGMQHAHAHGVIHRDLKPANILVDAAGQPKILDFGIARITGADGGRSTTLHTDVGQLLGTLPYMSPEQVAGDPARIDARTDVYALGVIAYELLTGRLPHDVRSRTIPEAVRAIREDEPTPLSSINKVFRGDLDTIIGKALEKDSHRRYRSPGELGDDIHRYLNDQLVLARQPSAAYQIRKFARRNKALVGGTLAVVIVLTLGVIGTTIGLLRAESAATEQARLAGIAAAAEADARAKLQQTVQLLMQLRHAYDELSDLPGATKTRESLAIQTINGLPRAGGVPIRRAPNSDSPELGTPSLRMWSPADGGPYSQGPQFRFTGIGDPLIANGDPGYGELSRFAAYSFQRMGEVQLVIGKSGAALESFQIALNLWVEEAERSPNDYAMVRTFGVSHWKMGEALHVLGRHEEAKQFFRASFEVLAHLEVVAAERVGNEHYFGATHRRLAEVEAFQGLHEQALAGFTDSVKYYDQNLAAQPENWPSHEGKVMALRGLGEVLLAMGERQRAMEPLRESLRVVSEIESRVGSASVFARTQRSLGLMAISRAHAAMDDDEQAIKAAEQASEVAESLAEADAFNFESRYLTARCRMALASALAESDRNRASASWAAALALLDALSRTDPDNALVKRDLEDVQRIMDESGSTTGTVPTR